MMCLTHGTTTIGSYVASVVQIQRQPSHDANASVTQTLDVRNDCGRKAK